MSIAFSNGSISKRHQSFAATAVLPGEDPKEFSALFDEIWGDLRPRGPLERSLAREIASLLWRKGRLGIFRVAEAARKEFGEFFADGDLEAGGLRASHHRMQKQQASLERLLKSREFLEEVKSKFRDSGLRLDEIEKQIGTDPEASRDAAADTVERQLAKDRTETEFAVLGDLISPECFIQELELRERLDAAIERALDRFHKCQAIRISGSVVGRRPPQGGRGRYY
jgi:hypothetical protein